MHKFTQRERERVCVRECVCVCVLSSATFQVIAVFICSHRDLTYKNKTTVNVRAGEREGGESGRESRAGGACNLNTLAHTHTRA